MTSAEWERVYGSDARVRWVRDQPCVFCGEGPCVNAHVTNGGMSRKADAQYIVPACDRCHWQLDHGIGKKGMERKHKKNLRELARLTDARWKKTLLSEDVRCILDV